MVAPQPIPQAERVQEPPICPYCGADAQLVDSSTIYSGQCYGLLWLCEPCHAYVGVHRGTTRPLGTLANRELRVARAQAHKAFDALWRQRGGMTRRDAYRLMAEWLDVPPMRAHIAMLTVEQCRFLRARVLHWRGEQVRA